MDSGKSVQGIKDYSFLFILSSPFPSSPFCFLCLLFIPFLQSSHILGKLSLSVGSAFLVPGKSLNAPASELLPLHVEMNPRYM